MAKNESKLTKNSQKLTKNGFFDFSGWWNLLHLIYIYLSVSELLNIYLFALALFWYSLHLLLTL